MRKQHFAWNKGRLLGHANPIIGKLLVSVGASPTLCPYCDPFARENRNRHAAARAHEQILDWATVQHLREGPNPARWRGHLDKLLAAPSKIAKVKHHTALAVANVPKFMRNLHLQQGMGARALEFAILTAARSSEVRGSTWGEIDIDNRI